MVWSYDKETIIKNYNGLDTNKNIIKLNRIIKDKEMSEYFDIIIKNFSKKLNQLSYSLYVIPESTAVSKYCGKK